MCLAGDAVELGRQLVSSIATYPDADHIVLVANGVGATGSQLADLRALVPATTTASVQLETILHAVSPEQAFKVAWEVLPIGAKVVAFCIRECAVRCDARLIGLSPVQDDKITQRCLIEDCEANYHRFLCVDANNLGSRLSLTVAVVLITCLFVLSPHKWPADSLVSDIVIFVLVLPTGGISPLHAGFVELSGNVSRAPSSRGAV